MYKVFGGPRKASTHPTSLDCRVGRGFARPTGIPGQIPCDRAVRGVECRNHRSCDRLTSKRGRIVSKVKVTCPECDAVLALGPSATPGKNIRCPKCEAIFPV